MPVPALSRTVVRSIANFTSTSTCSAFPASAIRLPLASSPQRAPFSSSRVVFQKADIKLLAQLRKETQISMSKAKEALLATNNDYKAALEWLEKDAIVSGAAKAAKLAGRNAKDGLVGVVVGSAGLGGAIVEMNTETDFVAKNPIFADMVAGVGATALFLHSVGGAGMPAGVLHEVDVANVLSSPLMPHPTAEMNDETPPELSKTVGDAIAEVVGKVGENIQLKRIAVAGGTVQGNHLQLTGGYVHSAGAGNASGSSNLQGRIGALVVVDAKGDMAILQAKKITQLAKNLAQHIVGFAPKYVREDQVEKEALPEEVKAQIEADAAAYERYLDEVVLARQPFFLGGGKVTEVLDKLSKEVNLEIKVENFVRWEVAE